MANLVTHTLYDNYVLANEMEDRLLTRLSVTPFFTLDTSLVGTAGTLKEINTYTYTGSLEELARGQGNTIRGAVAYTAKEYRVKLKQQAFDYADEDVMKDPMVVTEGMYGMSTEMRNELTREYFAEAYKASLRQSYSSLGYTTVVEAIAKLNVEDEAGLFLIINPNDKAEIRLDPDYRDADLATITRTGIVGTISGVPIYVSKEASKPILATKKAVTLFMKKGAEVEQERDADRRINSVYGRKYTLMALTDEREIVVLDKSGTMASRTAK